MGCGTCKLFICLLTLSVALPLFVYADQYYDPVTRRYIESTPSPRKPPVLRQPLQPMGQNILPTQAEIAAERRRIEQERIAAENAKRRQATESSGIQARRKFDPNRYHRTEDIIISPN